MFLQNTERAHLAARKHVRGRVQLFGQAYIKANGDIIAP